MKKITMQSEANNAMVLGTLFYFQSEEDFLLGDKLTFANFSKTIQTEAAIIEKTDKFYKGVIVSKYPIEDRRDLIQVL